jgi:hypothetical protein
VSPALLEELSEVPTKKLVVNLPVLEDDLPF